jgi:predicted ATPase
VRFVVLPRGSWPPSSPGDRAYLRTDNWDDYSYKTLYGLVYVGSDGESHDIGGVKIARFGIGSERGHPALPERFETLPDDYFSLGQDDTYYSRLNDLGAEIRDSILAALRDLASDRNLFERARHEDVVGVSLMRGVSASSVTGQYHRLASGGARLTEFAFSYTPPVPRGGRMATLSFAVRPESEPPTNIHVIIGRNGVGKTRLLQYMAQALVSGESNSTNGELRWSNENDGGDFANLVSVSFSAFDDFEPLPNRRNKATGMQYAYVGLKWQRGADGKQRPPKSPEQLSKEFVESVRICRSGARSNRWLRALEMLEADPIFNDVNITAITEDPGDTGTAEALDAFQQLSSGHKIVLLTMTRLVEVVEERTLVLLDEPEAHLHPPLLSAFVRSLSDLMTNRNAVAIIATHSPVVLQEAPRSCVWKIRRSANAMAADRPDIETFGENVGVLTREVFGLEVTQSGFHRLLTEAVAEDGYYDDVVERFGDQLGGEALALVRALAAERRRQRFS